MANAKTKQQIISEIKEAASKADKIYLASDPDREGEAIA
jgi:DNA topoisomerase-1